MGTEKIAESIMSACAKRRDIPKDKYEIYLYGVKLILADVINFSLVILLGIIIRRFTDSVVFLVTLCGVRRYAGGFHAKTFGVCRLAMLTTFSAVMLANATVGVMLRNAQNVFVFQCIAVAAVNVICTASIGIMAPVKHKNKVLNEIQRINNRCNSVIASVILSAASVILTVLRRGEGVTITLTLIATVVLMIIGAAVGKGGKKDV